MYFYRTLESKLTLSDVAPSRYEKSLRGKISKLCCTGREHQSAERVVNYCSLYLLSTVLHSKVRSV